MTTSSPLTLPTHGGPGTRAPSTLPQPVAAVLTDRADDVAVAEAAARRARPRQAPLLLIAVLPHTRPGAGLEPSSAEVRAVLGRVLSRVGPLCLGHIPAAFPAAAGGRVSRLRPARLILELASRHRSLEMFAARSSPHGLDAHTLMEAAAHHGGPRVHAVAPHAWVPLLSRSADAAH